MFKLIAEFYGLYYERNIGAGRMVLGNYTGKWEFVDTMDKDAFRKQCEAF